MILIQGSRFLTGKRSQRLGSTARAEQEKSPRFHALLAAPARAALPNPQGDLALTALQEKGELERNAAGFSGVSEDELGGEDSIVEKQGSRAASRRFHQRQSQ